MAKKEVAVRKRAKIDQARKQILALCIGTSIFFGLSVVSMHYLRLNTKYTRKLITAKEDAARGYSEAIKDVGICRPPRNAKTGYYEKAEIEACDPSKLTAAELPNTLRYNILNDIANNKDLESVARESLSLCYDDSGKKIDYEQKRAAAKNEREENTYADLTKKCSSIRVVSDAIPSKKNTEALMASLNKIMLLSNWQPEKITPDGEIVRVDIPGLGFMPVKFSISSQPETVYSVVENIERSIRFIDINRATFTWTKNEKIEFSARATAYYSEEEGLQKKTTKVTLDTGTTSSKKNDKKKGSTTKNTAKGAKK